MSNPSRAKGTAAETLFVRYANSHGFPWADRQPLRGNRDCGDVVLVPGIIVEVKSHRLPTGFPTAGQLSTWIAQTSVETLNARARFGLLVLKRPGTNDVARWFAFLPMADLALLTDAYTPATLDAEPVCLTVQAALTLYRHGGWGAEAPVPEQHSTLAARARRLERARSNGDPS